MTMIKVQRSARVRLVISALCLVVLTGCASGISKEVRSQVTYAGDFKTVQSDPDRYSDQVVHWGGQIVENRSTSDSSDLTLLALTVSRWGKPGDIDGSPGRFLLKSDDFLDPAVYPAGTRITVVGRLNGSEAGKIGERDYQFPVVDSIEVKKWPPPSDNRPRFNIGIGVGTRF